MAGDTSNTPQLPQRIEGAPAGSGGPRYAVDATWPKPLPNNWILGQVAGIAVATDDTIWMIHRPLTLTDDEAYELTMQVTQGQMSKTDLAGILTQVLELVD